MNTPRKDLTETNYGTKTASGNPRIFNCEKCKRAFTREEHLTRHVLSTHNKLKPFTCGICSRPFSRRDLLLRHAKNLHGGSEHAVSRIRKLFKRNGNENVINTTTIIPMNSPPNIAIPMARPTRSLSTSSAFNTSGSINNLIHTDVPHSQLVYTGYNNMHYGSLPANDLSKVMERNSPRINTTSGQGEQEVTSLNLSYDTPDKKRMKISVNMLVS